MSKERKREKKESLGSLIKQRFKSYIRELEVVDYRTIVSIVFLWFFGLIMVYSASYNSNGASLLIKQAGIGLVGFIAMIAISYIDYHFYIRWSGWIYLFAMLSLFLVKVPGLGVTRNGASRWIEVAGISFQPSELLKPSIIILTAFSLQHMGRKLAKVKGDIVMMLPAIVAAGLIYVLTKNLSTALIVVGIMLVMFFVAHPNKGIWIWILMGIVLLALMSIVVYQNVLLARETGDLDSFRLGRVLTWLYPQDYVEESRQSTYALYAIGFGGLLGRGLGNGTVKYYLPEPMNDFIFAVVAEELGIVGCAIVLFLFVYQIWRILMIARHAKDYVGNYIALGIGAHIALQVILNIAVTTSLIPNTGISLPYISYGGTALFIQMAEMGILLNISRQVPGKRVRIQGQEGSGSTEQSTQQQKIA